MTANHLFKLLMVQLLVLKIMDLLESMINCLDGVLYVPKYTSNMISFSSLIDSNSLYIIFDFEKASLLDKHSQTTTSKASHRRGLYVIQS